MNNAVWIGLV